MQKGYLVPGFIKKGAVWSTPVLGGALDACLFTMIGAGAARDYVRDKSFGHGGRTQLPGFPGNFKHQFEIGMPMRYGGYNVKRWIAGIFGSVANPTTVDTSARQHIFKMAKDLAGLFWTFGYEGDKDTEVFEYPSIKILGITIRGTKGQALELSIRVAAHSLNQNQGAGTNNTTSIDTLTFGTDGTEEIMFHQGQALCNAQGGAGFVVPTLGVLNDAIVIDGFELNIDGKFNTEKYNTEYGANIAEPQMEETEDQVTLKLNLSEYGAGNRGRQWVVDQLAKNQKKLKLSFLSPTLAGAATQKYQFSAWLPRVVFDAGAPGVTEKGEPKWDLTGICHHVDTIPTGFPAGYTDACTLEIFDKDTVNPTA
jgi:hypothetical protein